MNAVIPGRDLDKNDQGKIGSDYIIICNNSCLLPKDPVVHTFPQAGQKTRS